MTTYDKRLNPVAYWCNGGAIEIYGIEHGIDDWVRFKWAGDGKRMRRAKVRENEVGPCFNTNGLVVYFDDFIGYRRERWQQRTTTVHKPEDGHGHEERQPYTQQTRRNHFNDMTR